MNDLLDLAVKAHGGLERWNKVKSVKVAASITGAIWFVKGQGDALKEVVLTADTSTQRLTVDFPGQDKRAIFEPQRIVIQHMDGTPITARDNPEQSFVGQQRETPWDDIHVIYFVGEALWTYLTLPFLYTYPGFACEEVDPWEENGEQWRRLKVTFPDRIVSHSKTQITHFGPDGLMRRHDYTVDILGGATGANYSTNYRNFQGLMMPTTRRIYAYDEAMQKVPEPLLVSLDFGMLTFS